MAGDTYNVGPGGVGKVEGHGVGIRVEGNLTHVHGADTAAIARVFEQMRAALGDVADAELRGDIESSIRELETATGEGLADQVQVRARVVRRLAAAAGSAAVTTATTAGTTQLLQLLGIS